MGQFKLDSTFGDLKIFDVIYPVGSIYQTTSETFDPNEVSDGTWELIKGRFLFSVDPDREEYEKPCHAGGEETHQLSLSEMPSHDHTFRGGSHTFLWGQSSATVYASGANATAGKPTSNQLCTIQGSWNATNSNGSGTAHNNMPPYYTVFTWHRIS